MHTDQQTRVHIRWMIQRDLPEVLAIDWHGYALSWLEEDFRACLRERNCIGAVAEVGDTIAGYMVYDLHETHLDLLRLAVHPAWRRRGAGTALILRLQSKIASQRRRTLRAVVRDSQTEAHLFLRSQGLVAVDVLRGHFGDEDGYEFVYHAEE